MKNFHRGQAVFWAVFAVAIVGLIVIVSGAYAPRPQSRATGFTSFYPPGGFDYSGANGDDFGFGGFGGETSGSQVSGEGPFQECVIDYCVNSVTGRRVDENSSVKCMAPSKTTFCGSQECVNSGLACIESGGFGMGSTKDGGFSEGGGPLGGGGSSAGGESDRSINDCPYITQPNVECDGKWIINENTCTSECVRGKSGPSGGGCPAGSSYCDLDTTEWDGSKQKCVAKNYKEKQCREKSGVYLSSGCYYGAGVAPPPGLRCEGKKKLECLGLKDLGCAYRDEGVCVVFDFSPPPTSGGGGGGKLCGTTNPITCSAGQICVATIGGAVGEDGRSRIGFECANGKIEDWLDSESCWRNLFYNPLNYDNADVVCAAP